MSNILYFECLSGISGDMTVAALLDLGVDFDYFKTEIGKLGVTGYEISCQRKVKEGISGTDFKVTILEDNHNHHHEHEHGHEHNHSHHHIHQHRNLSDIEQLIDQSELSLNVKTLSKKIFGFVAEAEAKIHGKTLEEVHFHEVGAIDSIIDIVGTAICIDSLNVDEVIFSPLHLGTGFVKCQHGWIPVPAPATLEILEDVPVYSKGIESELVTPTGAAIAKGLGDSFGSLPNMIIEKTGYGLGKKTLDIKNVLRVIKGKKKLQMI